MGDQHKRPFVQIRVRDFKALVTHEAFAVKDVDVDDARTPFFFAFAPKLALNPADFIQNIPRIQGRIRPSAPDYKKDPD